MNHLRLQELGKPRPEWYTFENRWNLNELTISTLNSRKLSHKPTIYAIHCDYSISGHLPFVCLKFHDPLVNHSKIFKQSFTNSVTNTTSLFSIPYSSLASSVERGTKEGLSIFLQKQVSLLFFYFPNASRLSHCVKLTNLIGRPLAG